MTYRHYIDTMNELYAKHQQFMFMLVETEKDGTFPIYSAYYDGADVERIDVDEAIQRFDHEIYTLTLLASEEPWYQMHRNRHTQTYEILTHGIPSGYLAEKPKHDFKDFEF